MVNRNVNLYLNIVVKFVDKQLIVTNDDTYLYSCLVGNSRLSFVCSTPYTQGSAMWWGPRAACGPRPDFLRDAKNFLRY